MEKKVLQSMLALTSLAEQNDDPSMSDFLEDMVQEQHEALKKVADHVTNLKRVFVLLIFKYFFKFYLFFYFFSGEGVGVFLFDKNLQ